MLVKSNFGFCLRLYGADTLPSNVISGEVATTYLENVDYVDMYVYESPLIPKEEGDSEMAIDNTLHFRSIMRDTYPVKLVPFGSISDVSILKDLLDILGKKYLFLYAPKSTTTINSVAVQAFPVKLENATDSAIYVVCPTTEFVLEDVDNSEKNYNVNLTFERKFIL